MKLFPGKTIGILGGGQLGLMTALAARPLGYKIAIFEPGENSPASIVADYIFTAPYSDYAALQQFAKICDVITLEFENIPTEAIETLNKSTPVRPSASVLQICQHREHEKTFLREHGFPCVHFAFANSAEELVSAAKQIGFPCVAKTVAWGYDGKGQRKICSEKDVQTAWQELNTNRVIVEEWIEYQLELSIICARNPRGEMIIFPPAENKHTNHILDVSIVPGRFSDTVAKEAEAIGCAIAEKLQLEGLLGIEFFLTRDNRLLVNEMAPRPHNSGHYTQDGCSISQFEQHVRAVCNLSLGNTALLQASVMVNILGDSWRNGEPDWDALLSESHTHLHLYGKKDARIGRKMGHFNVAAATREEAIAIANQLRKRLGMSVFK